jgi:predicted AlkP superfamily phosphohydrolase/phosphomutase
MTRNRVVFVGLDACDPGIAQRLAATGRMPALRRLFERAARCRVQNPYGLFVGALWLSMATGHRADRHQFHCWDEVDVASYERRLTSPPAYQEHSVWNALSDAGRRVAVLDVPHSRVTGPVNGIQVVEWGAHDRHFGFHTWPPQRAADIDSTFGLHTILGLDAYAVREFAADDYTHRSGLLRTPDEEVSFLTDLMRGLKAKRKLNTALLSEDRWDLFLTIFGESHAIGHQQWHLHDPDHPRFRPDVLEALGGDPIAQVYGELDAGVGDLLAHIDDDTTVLVLLSHGMGPHYDGTHLFEEVLGRLDAFHERERRESQLPGGAKGSLPRRVRRAIRAFAVPWRRGVPVQEPFPEFADPYRRARQRYYLEPNNSVVAGVRLNLAGREPHGYVEPSDVDAVVRQLTDDLLELVNVETGGAVVRAVHRSDRWYRRSATDTFPDLFVEWECSRPIETVWSPKTGRVHADYTHWRTGDHRPDGLLLALGPGIPPGAVLPAVDVEDIAPCIAARLGVRLDDTDGRAVPWLGSGV